MARDNLDRGDQQDVLALLLLRSSRTPQEEGLTKTGACRPTALGRGHVTIPHGVQNPEGLQDASQLRAPPRKKKAAT